MGNKGGGKKELEGGAGAEAAPHCAAPPKGWGPGRGRDLGVVWAWSGRGQPGGEGAGGPVSGFVGGFGGSGLEGGRQ